jgi:hypothetical protein
MLIGFAKVDHTGAGAAIRAEPGTKQAQFLGAWSVGNTGGGGLAALLLVVLVNTAAWLLIATVICHCVGVTAHPLFLFGMGLVIAPLSGLAFAVARLAH